MKTKIQTTSSVLFLLGAILLVASFVIFFLEGHYFIATMMMIAAFANFADGIRRRNTEKR